MTRAKINDMWPFFIVSNVEQSMAFYEGSSALPPSTGSRRLNPLPSLSAATAPCLPQVRHGRAAANPKRDPEYALGRLSLGP